MLATRDLRACASPHLRRVPTGEESPHRSTQHSTPGWHSPKALCFCRELARKLLAAPRRYTKPMPSNARGWQPGSGQGASLQARVPSERAAVPPSLVPQSGALQGAACFPLCDEHTKYVTCSG